MRKTKNRLKGTLKYLKYCVYTLLAVFAVFVMPPLLINYYFSLPSENAYFVARWSAGDMLGYYAASITALGTTFLGVVVLIQNKNFRDDEVKREEARILAKKPKIDCVDIQNYPRGPSTSLILVLNNFTSIIGYDVSINKGILTGTKQSDIQEITIGEYLSQVPFGKKEVLCNYSFFIDVGYELFFELLYCDSEHRQYGRKVSAICMVDKKWKIQSSEEI